MELKEAVRFAKEWSRAARGLEKACKRSGYKFMASDSGQEAEVLETLIAAAEGKGEA